MKKVLVIACAVALLVSIASVAMATEEAWTMMFRASSTNPAQGAGNNMQLGTKTNSVEGKDTNDTKGTFAATTAAVGSLEPTFTDVPPLYQNDFKAKLVNAGDSARWDIRLWLGTGYGFQTLQLGWWASGVNTVPATIGGKGVLYELFLLADPTGEHATLVSPTQAIWSSTAPVGGSSTAPLDKLIWTSAAAFAPEGTAGTLKMAAGAAGEGGIRLQFKATVVPEPGSMLALGSGLIGLAGFAIRRRRA